jgi:hypothetical protein
MDEQRLLTYKKTWSGSLASFLAGLGPQYVRAKNMVRPELKSLPRQIDSKQLNPSASREIN